MIIALLYCMSPGNKGVECRAHGCINYPVHDTSTRTDYIIGLFVSFAGMDLDIFRQIYAERTDGQ